jgi:hypothetical protein
MFDSLLGGVVVELETSVVEEAVSAVHWLRA